MKQDLRAGEVQVSYEKVSRAKRDPPPKKTRRLDKERKTGNKGTHPHQLAHENSVESKVSLNDLQTRHLQHAPRHVRLGNQSTWIGRFPRYRI